MASDLTVRAAGETDYPAIARLLDERLGAHPLDQRLTLWRWRSEANPARTDTIPAFFVAESGDGIVAVHGLLPLRMHVDGRELMASCACDLAASPRGRAAGLKLKFAVMDGTVAPLHFSTSANEPAYRMMTALGGHPIDAARGRFLRVLRLDALVRRRFSSSLVGGLASVAARAASPAIGIDRRIKSTRPPAGTELRPVTSFDGFDVLDAALRSRFRVSVIRDADYLAWRYLAYPFPGIQSIGLFRGSAPLGLVVVHVTPDEDGIPHGAILDLIAAGAGDEARAILDALLSAAVEAVAKRGGHYVTAQATDPLTAGAFTGQGFMARTPELSPCTYRFAAPLPNGDQQIDDGWFISLGDGDSSFFFADGTQP